MKKSLLLLALSIGVTSISIAQSRYVLYEEFSGENCGPCASVNPGLNALLNSGTNPDNILIIKYQSPIPSAGPIYNQNTAVVNNRTSYYSVPFAPYGRMDGAVSPGGDGAGNPGYLTQAAITTQAAVASPFTITLSDVVITASDVIATIDVSAVTAGTYTSLKLRTALVETLDFAVAPGTNGETHFTNVVRQMYPSGDGLDVSNSWTAGATGTYFISGFTPSYVNLAQEHFLVVWLQDDAGKVVYQTARSFPELEMKSESIVLTGSTPALLCGAPNTFTPQVVISNKGTTTLTSAKIFYKENTASSWSTYDWTGSLALNATATVTLPSITTSAVGQVVIRDSVGMPNGLTDKFLANNVSGVAQTVLANTGGVFPITADFEGSTNGFTPYATGSKAYPFYVYNIPGKGYDASNGVLFYNCYRMSSKGLNGYSILPFANLPTGPKALDFYVAYCQYDSENDKLEVVYSTDCGSTWTSIWSKQGAALATKEKQVPEFFPTENGQWRKESVDMSSVPAGAQIAFKATNDYGNNIFVDNVNLRAGATSSVEDVMIANSFEVFPNPVSNEVNISLNAKSSFNAAITITNVSGQIVNELSKQVTTGNNVIAINVAALPTGVYMISFGSDAGQIVRKFVKK